jgi:hypothetical protein
VAGNQRNMVKMMEKRQGDAVNFFMGAFFQNR